MPGTGPCVGGSRLRHVAPPGGRDDRAGRAAARRHRRSRKPFGGTGVDAQGTVREQGACPLDAGGERGGGGRGCRTAGAVRLRRTVPGDGPDTYRGRGSGGGRALDGGGLGSGPGRFGGGRPHGHRGGRRRRCRGEGRSLVRVRARHGGRKVTEQRSAAAEPGGRRQRGERCTDPAAHPGGGVPSRGRGALHRGGGLGRLRRRLTPCGGLGRTGGRRRGLPGGRGCRGRRGQRVLGVRRLRRLALEHRHGCRWRHGPGSGRDDSGRFGGRGRPGPGGHFAQRFAQGWAYCLGGGPVGGGAGVGVRGSGAVGGDRSRTVRGDRLPTVRGDRLRTVRTAPLLGRGSLDGGGCGCRGRRRERRGRGRGGRCGRREPGDLPQRHGRAPGHGQRRRDPVRAHGSGPRRRADGGRSVVPGPERGPRGSGMGSRTLDRVGRGRGAGCAGRVR